MIIASDAGARTAGIIREELGKEVDLFSVSERSGCVRINSITDFTLRHFGDYEAFVFIGAMGICVRAIAPCVTSKYADPAVVNVDATGHFVVSEPLSAKPMSWLSTFWLAMSVAQMP